MGNRQITRKISYAAATTLLVLGGTWGLTGCEGAAGKTAAKDVPTKTSLVKVKPKSTATQPAEMTFTVAATGDALTHDALMPDVSRDAAGNTHFTNLMAGIKPFLEGADLAICHQEIAFAADGAAYQGFPNFAMPTGWAQDMKGLGYDGCSTASNHTTDQGIEGVYQTLNVLEKAGLGATGSRRSAAEKPYQMYQLTKDGRTIKIAHLSLAWGKLGGMPYIREKPWLVNVDNMSEILKWAAEARQEGANVVILSGHNGLEYELQPSSWARQWAQEAAASGLIDLYIGHHPHVPQGIEKLPGGVDGKGMWTYWSVGNVISDMRPLATMHTDSEQIVWATIKVPAQGNAEVISAQWVGIGLEPDSHMVVPLAAAARGQIPPGSAMSASKATKYREFLQSLVGPETPELTEPPATPSPAQIKALPKQ
ncbi:CapA family protein [Mobiluncus curtisii]|uniref:Bacterial capsule synthesis protein n=1 Tax=Mobiluncus curtisii ATCC 51333 TaxID=887326 RepID=E6M088_9ACTO|nr:CapA family protein [Mobiluncus curtisii]EFU79368.1 bacterial capsule synthesis protein [Mobiluncus curtisii ATCC 51333]